MPAADDGDLADELAALSATFDAWQRAFDGEAPTSGETAASVLLDALTSRERDHQPVLLLG